MCICSTCTNSDIHVYMYLHVVICTLYMYPIHVPYTRTYKFHKLGQLQCNINYQYYYYLKNLLLLLLPYKSVYYYYYC